MGVTLKGRREPSSSLP